MNSSHDVDRSKASVEDADGKLLLEEVLKRKESARRDLLTFLDAHWPNRGLRKIGEGIMIALPLLFLLVLRFGAYDHLLHVLLLPTLLGALALTAALDHFTRKKRETLMRTFIQVHPKTAPLLYFGDVIEE